jgi:hypothetical protein
VNPRLHVLGRQQHVGVRLDEGADRVPELDPAARIQSGRRLVEQQQPRSAHQARPEVQLAAHAAGVGAHRPVTGVDEAEPLEHRRGGGLGSAPLVPEQTRHHLEVLARGHRRLDGGELPGEADHPPDLARLAAHVVARDPQRSPVEPQQRRHRADERRLAGAVRAEHRHDLAGLGDEIEAVERTGPSKALREPARLDRRCH